MFKKRKKAKSDVEAKSKDEKDYIHPSVLKKQELFKKRLLRVLYVVIFAPALMMIIIPAFKSLSSSTSSNVCYITEHHFFSLVAFDGLQKTITMFLPFLAWQFVSLVLIVVIFIFLVAREMLLYFRLSKIENPYSLVHANRLFLFNVFITLFAINMASSAFLQAEKAKLAQSTIVVQKKIAGSEEFYKQCLDSSSIVLSDSNRIVNKKQASESDKKPQEQDISDVPTASE